MKDYGTASHREIMAGMRVAIKIGKMIRAIKSPAVRHMIKQLIALIEVTL